MTQGTQPTEADARADRCAAPSTPASRTEEGLEQEFNSLDAQRESGEAFIKSQAARRLDLPARPLRRRRLHRRQHGPAGPATPAGRHRGRQDRLRRGLQGGPPQPVAARLRPDDGDLREAPTSPSSRSRSSSTRATSMGRLMLNVLLSFAQFEREIIGERTRDKIAAARRKGKWVGGMPLLGYDVDPTRSWSSNPTRPSRCGPIFDLYLEHDGCCRWSRNWNAAAGRTSAGRRARGTSAAAGRSTRTALHHLLTNVTYIGKLRYKDEVHDGEHAAIVEPTTLAAGAGHAPAQRPHRRARRSGTSSARCSRGCSAAYPAAAR